MEAGDGSSHLGPIDTNSYPPDRTHHIMHHNLPTSLSHEQLHPPGIYSAPVPDIISFHLNSYIFVYLKINTKAKGEKNQLKIFGTT